MTIYCYLENMRIKRNKTYKDIAAEVGISYPALWKINNGLINPSMGVIDKLCKSLDCDVGDLFSRKKPPPMSTTRDTPKQKR